LSIHAIHPMWLKHMIRARVDDDSSNVIITREVHNHMYKLARSLSGMIYCNATPVKLHLSWCKSSRHLQSERGRKVFEHCVG